MAAPETISEPVKWAGPAFRKGGLKFKNARVEQCIQFVPPTGSTTEGALSTTSTLVSRFIHVVNTPATVDRMFYASVTYTAGKEVCYFIGNLTATSGTLETGRFRAEGAAASSATTNIHGVHAQGIAYASKYAGTVNAIYAEAIAKGTSTVVTIRGAMISCDSENTPTAIGTMLGAEIRAKTSMDPGTAYENLRLTAEKFGAGYALDAHIRIVSATWTSGGTAADAGIEFASTGKITSLLETSTPCTSVIKFSASTGKGTESGSLKDSDQADIKCDAYIKCMIDTTPFYIALYDTTN